MIIEETINGLLFQEHRIYRIYRSKEDRSNGKFILAISDEVVFLANKKLAKSKRRKGDKKNKFIIVI